MDERAATLEDRQTSPHDGGDARSVNDTPRVKGMRFTYPTGSRPLEGYTIKRGIGIGGFGEVYFALSDAGKEVALKRIQRNLDIELRGVRQCLNLKHINLIALWDIRTSDAGESWVVMEYVPGESLRDVIETHPQGMPEPLIHEWFLATAAGVGYLHDRGIVHRDLKPGNIFRDDDEQVVKIGDYGLSKFISCSTRDGQTESVGTFHYMAPEIGKGVYGKEIDVYALGIILFEMLTGRVPFEGESSQEIIMKHLTSLPDVDGLPMPYREVIRRSLQKDPQRRFASVPHMISELPEVNRANGNHRIEPVTPAREEAGSIAASLNPATDDKRVPPIQPMFISDSPHYIGDDEIRFGEVRQIVEAQITPALSPGRANANDVDFVAARSARLPEEPIARAVHGGWQRAVDWWHHADVSTPIKVVILVVAILVLLANAGWLIPACLGLGLVYLIYYAVRTWTLPEQGVTAQPRQSKAQVVARIRHQLAARPVSDRLAELVGSLVVSVIVCAIVGLLALTVNGNGVDLSPSDWAVYVWLVVTSVAGSWAILIANKTWEHRKGEGLIRRFVMVSIGLVVGLTGFLVSQFLHLVWVPASQFSDLGFDLFAPTVFLAGDQPRLVGYLVFFAGLFAILRWWKQADPVRNTRLSILATGMCLIWGMIVGQIFHFPLPWSCILAVMISVATQVSAPWLAPGERLRIQALDSAKTG